MAIWLHPEDDLDACLIGMHQFHSIKHNTMINTCLYVGELGELPMRKVNNDLLHSMITSHWYTRQEAFIQVGIQQATNHGNIYIYIYSQFYF